MILPLFGFSIFVLSFAAVIVRWADVTPDALGVWRMFFSVLFLLVYFALAGRLREIKVVFRRKNILALTIAGGFLFFHFVFWFFSIRMTSVANAATIFSLNPVFTAVGAWIFFQERIHLRLVLALILGITGIVALEWDKLGTFSENGAVPWGDIFGILSSIGFSSYVLVSKRIRVHLNNIQLTLGMYAVCGLCFLVMTLIRETPLAPYPAIKWVAFVVYALGPTLLGHAIFTHCLNHLNVNFMSSATLLEPVIAGIAASYLFDEPIGPATILSFIFISSAVLILYTPTRIRP